MPGPPDSEQGSWDWWGIFGHPYGTGPPVECVLQGEVSRGCHGGRSRWQCTCWGATGGGHCWGARWELRARVPAPFWSVPQLTAGAGGMQVPGVGHHGEVTMVGRLLWEEVTLWGGHCCGARERLPSLFPLAQSVPLCDLLLLHGHISLKGLWRSRENWRWR